MSSCVTDVCRFPGQAATADEAGRTKYGGRRKETGGLRVGGGPTCVNHAREDGGRGEEDQVPEDGGQRPADCESAEDRLALPRERTACMK